MVRRKLTKQQRLLTIASHLNGTSQRKIAREFKLSFNTIQYWINQWRVTSSIEGKKPNRRTLLDENDKEIVCELRKLDRTASINKITEKFNNVVNKNVSYSTI
eukprot:gb/GECH01008541.1/.p1 GENE.gb/GECH01008541.1/~~gb/GECH01008541.1/.p1  ORF type:complete len:103 (+),score=6.73 gb/GECH01008541.1/:1-309(+)